MRKPLSSSRTEQTPRPWYRELWPWLLAGGPALVVVASLCSAWIAFRSDDGLVAQDYYKRGLLINQRLHQTVAAADLHLSATVRIADNGEVRARVNGMTELTGPPPATARLMLVHPTRAADDLIVTLTREASGDYVGALSGQTSGRWIVSLESSAWRLPTTTVVGRVTEIGLGAEPGGS